MCQHQEEQIDRERNARWIPLALIPILIFAFVASRNTSSEAVDGSHTITHAAAQGAQK